MTNSINTTNTVASTVAATAPSELEMAFATMKITRDVYVEEVGGINIEKAGQKACSDKFEDVLDGLAEMDIYYDNCISMLPKAGALTKEGKEMAKHWSRQRQNLNRYKKAVNSAATLAMRRGSIAHVKDAVKELVSQNVLFSECFEEINDFGKQALTYGWPSLNPESRKKNMRDRGLRSAQSRDWYPNYCILIPSDEGYTVSTKKGDYVISPLEALKLYNSLQIRQQAPYSWNAVMGTNNMDYDGYTGVVENYNLLDVDGARIVLEGKKRISCEYDMKRVLTYPVLALQNPGEFGFYAEVTKKLFGDEVYLCQNFGEYSWYIACLNSMTKRVNGNRVWKTQAEQEEMVKSGVGLCKQYGFTSVAAFFDKEIAIPQILKSIAASREEKAAAKAAVPALPTRTPAPKPAAQKPEQKTETMSEQDAIKAFLARKAQKSGGQATNGEANASSGKKSPFSAANAAAAAETAGEGAPDLDLGDLGE